MPHKKTKAAGGKGKREAQPIMDEGPSWMTWNKCRDDGQRINRIRAACASYIEFQDDDEDVDSGKAFAFASNAANTYLPWATKELERLSTVEMKYELLKMRRLPRRKRSPRR